MINLYFFKNKHSKLLGPAVVGLLIIITLLVYVKVFNAEFVYDDFGFIVNNSAIQSFTPFSKFFIDPNIFTGSQDETGGKNWRPIASFLFAIEYYLFGANPFGFHSASILIHLTNIVLVFLLIRKITDNFFISTIVSSLWALHPVL